MTIKKSGFAALGRKLSQIERTGRGELQRANVDNAQLLADMARLLIPVDSGTSRAAIRAVELSQTQVMVDFGPKAKVIEGGSAPRPFVNPALRATRDRRRKRNAKALRAIRKALKRG